MKFKEGFKKWIGGYPEWWPLFLIVIVAMVVGAIYFSVFHEGLTEDHGRWGQFGDYVGGLLKPLVAVLALAMLIKATLLQKEELKATREEMRLAREVSEEQRMVSDAQRKVMQRQLFESQFFAVIPLFVDAVRYARVQDTSSAMVNRIKAQPIAQVESFMAEARAHYEMGQAAYAPVIALLQFAVNLLRANEPSMGFDDKSNYGAILRGFISDYEAWVIFVAILDVQDGFSLEEAVEKYRLCAGMSEKLRVGLWNAPDRPTSFVNRLGDNFLPH
jgi:hypothetical protein